jgi:hypothetical protein
MYYINLNNFNNAFVPLTIWCSQINLQLLEFDNEELVSNLKEYSILNYESNILNEQVRVIKRAIHPFSLIDCNEHINNKLPLRILLLLYYRMLKKCIAEGINTEIDPELRNYINNLDPTEKEHIYQGVVKDLCGEPSPSRGSNIAHILRNVISDSNVNDPLFMEFEEYCRNQRSILFYPSSNTDISDINYFNERGNNIFSEHNIFIHCDYYEHTNISIPDIYVRQEVSLATNFSNASRLIIHKLKNQCNEIWLLFFSCTRNEQLLVPLLQNRIAIDTIFCKCDGILYGMGGPDEAEGFSIPTALYICFYQLLSLKRIITQFGLHFFEALPHGEQQLADLQESIISFRSWLSANLYPEIANPILSQIEDRTFIEIIAGTGTEIRMTDEYRPRLLDNTIEPFYLVTF